MYCPKCGNKLEDGVKFCPNCGYSLAKNKPKKDPVLAAILAIFLGGLGIHRFYLGQWWGILYILFCWTYVPALIGLIEGIYWLVKKEEFLEKYG